MRRRGQGRHGRGLRHRKEVLKPNGGDFPSKMLHTIPDSAGPFSQLDVSVYSKLFDRHTSLISTFFVLSTLSSGKASQAASGLHPEKANEILDELILCYEPLFGSSPSGKTFQECYDLETLRPTDEYNDVYAKAVDRVRSIGLNMRF